MKSNKLGSLTSKIGSGVTPRGGKSVYQNSGTYLVRSQNIYNDKLEKKGLVCISDEIADKMKAVELLKNDVLINITGDSVARVHIIPDEILPARVNQHVCILRPKLELNPYYLYYFLISKNTQNHLLGIAGIGGTRNALTKDMLSNLIIEYPKKIIQEKIVKKLNDLDLKIKNLRKQNEILEQIAQTVFKSWFVDYDGVTEFEDSELGRIPKGWEIKPIQDLCSLIQNGGTPKRMNSAYWEHGSIDWYKTGELHDNFLIDSDEKITELGLKKSSCHLWPENTILIAIYAFPVVGRLGILTKSSCSNQACTGLIPKNSIGNYFLFFSLIFSRDIMSRIATGAAQQNISQDIVKNHKIVVPSISLISKFNEKISPFLELIKTNEIELKYLSTIRDTLLPKLMSGEIRVSSKE